MIDVTEPQVVSRRRDFRLVRTQRVLQIILGFFWLLDAGLQFQPYMFSSNFTTTYLLNNAQNQPDVDPVDHHECGQFRGAPCCRVEHLLCAHSGGHRTGTAVPADGAAGACRVVLLGLRGLVLRGRPRPDFHRVGLRPHRCPGFGVPLRIDRPDGMATVSSPPRRTPRRKQTSALPRRPPDRASEER